MQRVGDCRGQSFDQRFQPQRRHDPAAELGACRCANRRAGYGAHAAQERTARSADGCAGHHRAAIVEGDVFAGGNQDIPDGIERDAAQAAGDEVAGQFARVRDGASHAFDTRYLAGQVAHAEAGGSALFPAHAVIGRAPAILMAELALPAFKREPDAGRMVLQTAPLVKTESRENIKLLRF